MRVILIVCGILLQLVALKIYYNDAVVFRFSNVVCDSFNKSWIVVEQCRLRAVSRNNITLYFNATLLHPVNNVIINGALFKRANGYKPWLYNQTLDVCRFLKKAYNPIAILMFKMYSKFSNMRHPCPYEGKLYISGLYLDWKLLPHTIPTGDYLLDLFWIFDKQSQLNTKIYFAFTEDL